MLLAYAQDTNRAGKRRNLEILWQVLNDIRASGKRDYSLAEVGRRSAALSGMQTQSLRNEQGKQFREIIHAYAAAVDGSTRYVAKERSQVDAALDMISDPSARVVLRTAIHQAKKLKEENDNLRAAFTRLSIGSSNPSGGETQEREQPLCIQRLSARNLAALRKGISRTRLIERGLDVQPDGSIKTDAGLVLFPPAFTLAINAIIESHDTCEGAPVNKNTE